MSHARLDVPTNWRIFKLKLESWLELGKHRLYAYRPRFRDWHFWAVQGLVILVATAHTTFEILQVLDRLPVHAHALSFVPISLFFIPVVYAALNFGLAGSVATALWVTILTIPNLVLFHPGMELVGELLQLSAVNAIAFFVGQRVDRERGARHQAEAAGDALSASEMKYRGLFESSPIAILVLDPAGIVLESNPAASVLFGRDKETLKSMAIANLIGTEGAQKLLDPSPNRKWQSDALAVELRGGAKVYLEPTLTQVSNPEGNSVTQVLFRDVTEELSRQVGLKAYAAHVLRAQEEERQRISRELHDETIQSLVLLCRRLDSVEDTDDSLPLWVISRLREIRGTAEEVVKDLRVFATALRPPILDDLGLAASVRRLLADFTERTMVEGEITVSGKEKQLPPDTKLGMYRIAQEALWNVERHAKASRVTVTITFSEHGARLVVIDNGVGFTVSPVSGELATSGRLGLIGMQERAELLGGKLSIQSEPGKGAKVTLSIPFPEGISEVSSHDQDS